MASASWAPLLLVAVGLGGHLWADARHRPLARAVLKALATAGFLLLAALNLAPGRYGALVAAGLLASAIGDLLLLHGARSAFLAGVGAFLLAHLAYAAAFLPRSRPSALVAAVLAAAAALIVRALWSHLGDLRVPVLVYAFTISAMLLLALGVASPLVRLGALLFYLSDLAVARDRFVAPGLANRVIGLPLYYAAQVLLALSTATA
jgi:uncharacterized membrane protein YhhN